MTRLPAAMLAALLCSAASALPVPEHVTFASLDRDAGGAPVMITALFYRPPQAAGAPVPLVIALHGCGGMFSDRADRRDRLSARGIAWTEELLADGYAVLWPDSFNPRGQRTVCLVKRGDPTITPTTRRLDVLGALAFAVGQPGIDRGRIALLGWSHGGSTTLAAVNGKDARVARFFAESGAPPPLRAAVAFYPGCGVALRQGDKWLASLPLAIHAAELDDWTPSSTCAQLADSARSRGSGVTIAIYPGAYHGFDAPGGKLTVLQDVTNGVNPDKGVTVGPNPAARTAANTAARAFLRERLQGTPK